MLFAEASFQTNFILSILLFMWFVSHVGKKWIARNPDVKDAANQAARKSVLSLIGKLFR
jgi:hypothetical protein